MTITIGEITSELNSFTTISDKKGYFDKYFADIITELLAVDDYDRELNIEKILNAFDATKMKGMIKRNIERALSNQTKQESKTKGAAFTAADLLPMMDKKGNITYTTSHVIDIIHKAVDVRLILDTMSEQPYFVKMPWVSLTNEFKLPLMTNGNTHIYYPYDNINRTALKKALNDNIFPDEKHWTGLDDVVEIVSHYEKIDMYQEWMLSLPEWDGIDRITNPETNWVVRYLKAASGAWSAAWARMLPLSQVWRCFNPGCRQRYYFALEGEQNIGKTSFCKALLPVNPYEPDNSYWYVSTSIKNIDKDFLQLVAPGAIIEFPDLDMNRFNLNDWKRFITETDIVLRLPYGRLVISHPKRSISIVTTNEHKYMRDPTGETRAIPIKSLLKTNTFIDHKAFRKEYPQIQSQIKEQYYLNKIEPFLTPEEIDLQNEQIEIRDVVHEWMEWEHIEEMIDLNIQYANKITIKDIVKYVCDCRGISDVSITQVIRNRYGQVLRKMGFESK
ncbi:MAG TPA: VapE domain-containing protein, partial [Chitinophagaceae bacterium]